jgi:hypothetical protein
MCEEEKEICENGNVEERISTREGVSEIPNTLTWAKFPGSAYWVRYMKTPSRRTLAL